MRRSSIKRLAAIAAFLTIAGVLPLHAQGRGGGFGFRGAFTGAPHRSATISLAHSGPGFRRSFLPGSLFLGEALWNDYSSKLAPESPPVIVVQIAPAASETKEEPMPAAAPLLVELQGDRYVRYSGEPTESASARHDFVANRGRNFSAGTPAAPAVMQATRRAELPAILIFRDGRHEEVSNYAIIGGVMYVGSNYWTSGAWQRKVQLADLDLPSTLKLNRDRGVGFTLPSAPNEVVTRP